MTPPMRPVALTLSVLLALSAACSSGRGAQRPQAEGETLTNEDLDNPNESIEYVLQRKAPGLLVTRTSGGIALQVRRGSSTYDGRDKPPLFVVNGLPFTPGPGGLLLGVDPYEIASIKLLRGGEAGMYGIDGADGVIVITTKKRTKAKP